jgi:transcriptional regulator with XRE-family HTH domain
VTAARIPSDEFFYLDEFVEAARTHLSENDMTVADVGRAAGRSRKVAEDILSGRAAAPTLATACLIADVCGLRLDDYRKDFP